LLEVPICLHGAEIGFIRVRGRRRSRAFDANDRQLLLTVAHQAALAVAFARSDSALASAQRLQTATLRQERASLIQTVAAELAAQIRHSSAVFRGFFRDAADGAGPGAGRRSGDVARATEEIVRLESLAAKLAQVTRHYLERRPTRVRDLVDRACLLVSESLAGRGLSIAVEDAAVVCCDPDSAARLVANLLANAAAATSGVAQPLIGVTWSRTEAGAELGISDNGGGFAGAAKDLFSPWSGGGARQPGLALAVAQRIAATHGWTLDARRVGGGTSFVVALPATTTRAVA
jgi:signal transduction histidine kinase